MRNYKLLLLTAVLVLSPGFRFRCYIFCTDQTSTQSDYIEQRDRCREDAQLKLDMSIKNANLPSDDKTKKSQLVNLFSECMAKNGWNVPNGQEKPATAGGPPKPPVSPVPAGLTAQQKPVTPLITPPAAPAQLYPSPVIAQENYQARANMSRRSECAFARQAVGTSTIAAARAKACDLECEQRLQASPSGARPAACPETGSTNLSSSGSR